MATCCAISNERDLLYLAYPSEPALVLGAAELMSDPETLRQMLECISVALRQGIVEPGVRGELVARLLVLMACDAYFREIKVKCSSLAFMSVSSFVKTLLGEAAMTQLRLPEELGEAVMNFTHITPVTYTPSSGTIMDLLERCAVPIPSRIASGVIPAVLRNGSVALLTFQVGGRMLLCQSVSFENQYYGLTHCLALGCFCSLCKCVLIVPLPLLSCLSR